MRKEVLEETRIIETEEEIFDPLQYPKTFSQWLVEKRVELGVDPAKIQTALMVMYYLREREDIERLCVETDSDNERRTEEFIKATAWQIKNKHTPDRVKQSAKKIMSEIENSNTGCKLNLKVVDEWERQKKIMVDLLQTDKELEGIMQYFEADADRIMEKWKRDCYEMTMITMLNSAIGDFQMADKLYPRLNMVYEDLGNILESEEIIKRMLYVAKTDGYIWDEEKLGWKRKDHDVDEINTWRTREWQT